MKIVSSSQGVTPSDIDISSGLVGDFNIVTRHVACNIVRLCQEAKNWTTQFSFDDLARVSSESNAVIAASLRELCERDFLISERVGDQRYYAATEKFITVCAPPPL